MNSDTKPSQSTTALQNQQLADVLYECESDPAFLEALRPKLEKLYQLAEATGVGQLNGHGAHPHPLALQACQALIEAYDEGEARGGSVAWEDVNAAYALACQALAQGHTDPAPRDPWQDNPAYSREDWRYAVANDDTVLGYLEWVEHGRERDASDCPTCEGSGRVGPTSFNPEMDETLEPCPDCRGTGEVQPKAAPRPLDAVFDSRKGG